MGRLALAGKASKWNLFFIDDTIRSKGEREIGECNCIEMMLKLA